MIRASYQAFQMGTQVRSSQYEQAHQLNKIIAPETKVLLLSHYQQRLNYLCKFKPALPEQFGYSFPENLTDEELEKCLQNVKFVLTEEYDINTFPRYQVLFRKNNFIEIEKIGEFQIWHKKLF